jgi:3-hydroxyacyl-CoA dehydrogenase/enoyl-CoA hydratase/3-hydroxybutyryl-CoA epimerase/3-hydroxyacyl-CoA dehydrogenase/enoyl-CoA hydratase/3-hydroxybutyryl-CoA epimerase/enoyl-CoA isomerase
MPESARERATLAIERTADGIAVISFSVPDHRQNVISGQVLEDLAAALDQLERGPRPTGLILRSIKDGTFFAGADLDRIDALASLPSAEAARLSDAGKALFSRLAADWPTVAVIDGTCLGGGLELALACDFRVATNASHTSLGFPEVKLGLLPGWGGTVRTPRLIGPGPAIELIASGEAVDGPAAARLGLIDACVPPDAAMESARRIIALRSGDAVAERRRQLAEPVVLDPVERDFLEATTAAVILGRTGGHYPAPPAILETILAGCGVDAEAASHLESKIFAALAATPVHRNLLRVFRLSERNRRDPGVGEAGSQLPAIASAAVVGAGIMGAGIAARHLRSGLGVTLVDIDPVALAASVPGVLEEAAWDRGAKRADPDAAIALAGRLQTATTLEALAGADLVIESVLERTDLKQKVLADIERAVSPTTIITTNTSTNPIAKLAEALTEPSRFCGMHFFNPVRRMILAEVIRGPATSDATVAAVVAHAKRLGKCPVVVRDSPGFLVNRVLMPYLHESVEMVREGVEPATIDRVARRFGMPLGPIELYDMIGLDTAFYAGLVLSAAYGDRIDASPLIPAFVKAGRLGRKSGAGFYTFRGTGPKAQVVGVDDDATRIISRYALPPRENTDRTIADRLLLPMLLEALRVLDEEIVREPSDIDLAVIHALGFPAFRGGIMAWADSLGAAEIVRRLEPLADLGVRMQPTASLLARAASGRKFTE